MAKVVYNTCYGGYGLSDLAIKRYAELKGLSIYMKSTVWRYVMDDEFFDGDDIPRHDRVLIQVVEELGSEADGEHARLRIREVPNGSRYQIEEYDGIEWVILESEVIWETAE
ncbi:hypothetical protein UFOVP245_33 [uncultured Caudovirales phage]|uniref:Uncharacterized protein n=1 Tax=uncultured Caudovirales phage TaxID=2100421 RepID=A0A6J7WVG6_9CAUD|nr:hypothetical protein UFOVP245_33 [uncultured Caudovirales phage]